MANLAQAKMKSLAHARRMMAVLPKATSVLAEIEAEGAEDWKFEGDAAMNPYMGAEGDAWARGYWAAKAGA